MKKSLLFLVIITIALLFNACSEAGLTGPEGPAGPSGPAGAVGAAGKDGSIMYSGTGVPATTLGVNGDYYLDKNNGNLYGPKTVAGWGTPFTLMGATGATGANGTNGTNGTNGSTTLSGSGTPSAAVGINGDYFLDKTNYLLYGPKSGAGWGTPILLRGADGAQGPTGAAGKDGSIMYSGTGAPATSIGINGDYYLDKNTGNLYGPKTAAGWGSPLILKGATGSTGATGANGTNGTNGSTTLSGNGAPSLGIGAVGDYYLDRANYQLYGPKSGAGWGTPLLLKGADGAQGPTGPAGKDGSVIYSGAGSPAPGLGVNGDYYLDTTSGNLYGPKTTGGWGSPTTLRGNNGTNGTNGSVTHSGLGTPDLSTGANGDYYLDRTNYLLYGPKNVDGWGVGLLLRGADGAQGPIGPAGADGSVIYAGDYYPAPALGKVGDFYVMKYPATFLGPKTIAGWPSTGINLKGADGTNGTNGNSILNGGAPPQNTQGNDGDFYIDLTTYTMYGPKAGGAWPYPGTSLKGADGNSNVIALETADTFTFYWKYQTGDTYVLTKQGTFANDTTSVFNIPAANVAAANTGTVLVYLRNNGGPGVSSWKQLNYTDYGIGVSYFYNYHLRIDATTAKVRVVCKFNTTSPTFNAVDKVRIVIVPPSSTGTLSNINQNTPMLQTMQKLNLRDKDFKKLN